MSATLIAVQHSVATITLNRPEVLNALNAQLMTSLRAHLEQAASDPAVRCVVITGAGAGFSAGADLASVQMPKPDTQVDLGAALRESYNPLIHLIRTMPKPVMSIALAGDIVLAGKSASFLQAFSKIGLVPDAGSTWFLPRLVGDMRARALMLLADQINAEQAHAYGMVWKVFEDTELMPQAIKMAEKLASMPTQAYALIKEAMAGTHTNDLLTQMNLEANLQHRAGQTADFREGVSAFIQKRKPAFLGR
jgi:2-(1,2-epoxy-1,2-dihydrophenyl)acetyl-CoA isomerase